MTIFEYPQIDIDAKRAELSALSAQLSDPVNLADYQKMAQINGEYKHVAEVVETWDSLQQAIGKYHQAEELAADPAMAELAQADLDEVGAQIEKLIEKFKLLTQTKLPDDEKNCIFEIRAGTGGTEANLFAEEISRMYVRYINSLGLQIEQISTTYGEEGGVKENIFKVIGHNAYGKLRFESGVHRVQRVPATEAAGRIHTSTISVVVLPEVTETDVDIKPDDIRVDVFRSSGAGGQGVNRTDSAVRITHIPSGIVVTSQEGRSQHKNKEQAMSILASRLYAIKMEEEAKASKDLRAQAIQSGDRSAKIRTYNFPQSRITDHRITTSWFNINEAMEGEIDNIVTTVNQKLRAELDAKA